MSLVSIPDYQRERISPRSAALPRPFTPPCRETEEPLDHWPAGDAEAAGLGGSTVQFTPADIVRRQCGGWRGAAAEIVQITRHERFAYRARSPLHLLIASERADQNAGEIVVEGLAPSRLRTTTRKLTFVPAGRELRGWSEPRTLWRGFHFYFDPAGPLVDPDLGFGGIDFEPRLHFDDAAIWATSAKLATLVGNTGAYNRLYAEALVAVLAHELVRLNSGVASAAPPTRGGLAGWQMNRVAEYIEANLAEPIALATLAELVRLSPFHFARAFKLSFSTPPHRYHTARRIDRAKEMLASRSQSVTDIALSVGFAETGSFTAAFRRLTGRTPTDYRRSLE
ncbi:MAG TPA: AraC family transcriptional regulator [Stellaceae bacterium]|nr:AraC family transcriptional regulator [Stellaceae bacterium]